MLRVRPTSLLAAAIVVGACSGATDIAGGGKSKAKATGTKKEVTTTAAPTSTVASLDAVRTLFETPEGRDGLAQADAYYGAHPSEFPAAANAGLGVGRVLLDNAAAFTATIGGGGDETSSATGRRLAASGSAAVAAAIRAFVDGARAGSTPLAVGKGDDACAVRGAGDGITADDTSKSQTMAGATTAPTAVTQPAPVPAAPPAPQAYRVVGLYQFRHNLTGTAFYLGETTHPDGTLVRPEPLFYLLADQAPGSVPVHSCLVAGPSLFNLFLSDTGPCDALAAQENQLLVAHGAPAGYTVSGADRIAGYAFPSPHGHTVGLRNCLYRNAEGGLVQAEIAFNVADCHATAHGANTEQNAGIAGIDELFLGLVPTGPGPWSE